MQELLKKLITLKNGAAAGDRFDEACTGREEMYGEVATGGRAFQDVLVPVTAACSRGAGRFDVVGLGGNAALEGEMQRRVFEYVRLLSDRFKPALRAHFNAKGTLVGSKGVGLDLMVQVGDGTAKVSCPEVVLPVLPVLVAVTLALFKPPAMEDDDDGGLAHVVLGGLLGHEIKPVELGQPEHFSKGKTNNIFVMLPALDSLSCKVNILAHPDTTKRFDGSKHNWLTYTSITRLAGVHRARRLRGRDRACRWAAGESKRTHTATHHLRLVHRALLPRRQGASAEEQSDDREEENEDLLAMCRIQAYARYARRRQTGDHPGTAHEAPRFADQALANGIVRSLATREGGDAAVDAADAAVTEDTSASHLLAAAGNA